MIDREYINTREKNADDAVKKFNSDETNRAMLRDDNIGELTGYNGNTFLYIRAFDGDNGTRPITSGVIFYLSPDIELYKGGILVDTSNPLEANINYTVKVTVTNDGDVDCNACTVDIFLCNPSIGFCVNGSQMLGVVNTPIIAHSKATVEFPFTTTKDMEGHRCMFARAYSLVNHDYPKDFINFDTYSDRHIGQQNLNIVKQGGQFEFNVDHVFKQAGKKKFEIIFTRDTKAVKKNREIQKKFIISNKAINTNGFKFEKTGIAKLRPELIHERVITNIHRPVDFENVITEGFDKEVRPLRKNIWLHEFESGQNKMKVDIPMLGLKPNEAVPMNLTVRDPETGGVIGGIMVLIVG